MNYIIFKEINSQTLQGLIVSELPPVSKPKMRTTVTKIDGRDGDIIDYLGYESYTKTIKIGLSKDFNIDEIINFFNGEGDLILSNESDKVYKAQILDQIDFERLIRFKTATIKFYVQPYKYLYGEKAQEIIIKEEQQIVIKNQGLCSSNPIITLYGTGTVDFLVNGYNVFQIDIDEDYVVIDSMEQEAYKEDVLKNRLMLGDFPQLKPGENIITWTGNLTKIVIEPKSRWL